jgi:hypothetical protein
MPREIKNPGYKSSIADLALVGAELFERLQETAADIEPGAWKDQPQHVRDGICILFAMVRNRTAPLPHDVAVVVDP